MMPPMLAKNNEIHGTFTFYGITFNAGYRFGGPLEQQGGFQKCLKIYHSTDGHHDGHIYFGDDKFMITNATFLAENKIEIDLLIGLRKYDNPANNQKKIILHCKDILGQ